MSRTKQVVRGLTKAHVTQVKAPAQTHMVLAGRMKHAAYQDGDVLRAVDDDRQLAFRTAEGKWSRAVQESRPRPIGAFDRIKPSWPAVTVELAKGRYY